MVDGGRGQLGVALSAARDLGLHDLPIVGPRQGARDRGRREDGRPRLPARPEERHPAALDELGALLPRPRPRRGAPLRQPRAQEARQVAAPALRDRRHPRARRRRRKKALLRELGSMAAVREATDERILAVTGVTQRHLTPCARPSPGPRRAADSRRRRHDRAHFPAGPARA